MRLGRRILSDKNLACHLKQKIRTLSVMISGNSDSEEIIRSNFDNSSGQLNDWNSYNEECKKLYVELSPSVQGITECYLK